MAVASRNRLMSYTPRFSTTVSPWARPLNLLAVPSTMWVRPAMKVVSAFVS